MVKSHKAIPSNEARNLGDQEGDLRVALSVSPYFLRADRYGESMLILHDPYMCGLCGGEKLFILFIVDSETVKSVVVLRPG